MDEIETCFREHWDEFVKKIARRCVNHADAEDVVSEAFKRAITYRQSYNPEKQAIHVWIFSIVLNAYHDYISDLFKLGMAVPATDAYIGPYETDFEGIATYEQLVQEINNLADGLTKDCLGMYVVLGMTPREIALVAPVNSKFVRNAVYRFKECIQEKFVGGVKIANKERVAV